MGRKTAAPGAVLGISCLLAGLEASPWIPQDRWVVLGPMESPADCLMAGDLMGSGPAPGRDLGAECPLPGDDWGEGMRIIAGAPRLWTGLAALGIGPGDVVDLGSYAGILGLNNYFVKAVVVTYAWNRTAEPIDVEVCWSSWNPIQIWVNDRRVARVDFCPNTLNCDCAGIPHPATLLPGTNRIAVASWEAAPLPLDWNFGIRLLRPDGRSIDGSADPDVEFSVYPGGPCPPADAFQAVRSIETVQACFASPGETRVTVRGSGAGDPGDLLTVIEEIRGAAAPRDISGGGVFAPADPLPPCDLEPRAPVGVFTDHRSIGGPCLEWETVLAAPDAYDVTAGGRDVFSCGESFHFASVSLRGDFNITVHIAERDWSGSAPPGRWGKLGLMARQTCSGKSRHAFVHDTAPNSSPPFPGGSEADPDGIAFDGRRSEEGDDSFSIDGQTASGLKHPDHLRLERSGSVFRGYASTDGEDWRPIGEMDWGPSAPCEVLAGLAVLDNAGIGNSVIGLGDCQAIRIRFDQLAISGGDGLCPPSGGPGGGRIAWKVKRSDLEAGVSYALDGSGLIRLSGNDGRHATEGADRLRLEAPAPVGPDFEDARTIGRPDHGVGSTAYDPAAGVYTQVGGGGFDLYNFGDGFQYASRRVRGDFDLAVQILGRDFPNNPGSQWGALGLMVRRSCLSNSRYTDIGEATDLLGNAPGLGTRAVDRIDGGSVGESFGYPNPDGAGPEIDQHPDFLRLVRRGSTFYGFLSWDGEAWDSAGADTWYGQPPEDPVLAGFFTVKHRSHLQAPVVRFQVLWFGPVDPPFPPPIPDGGAAGGQEVYRTGFDVLADFQVQHRDGTFDPMIAGGRLRMADQGASGSSTSAFRKVPIEDIDSAIYRFDFDAFFTRDAGKPPAEGLTFTVDGGRDAARVGNSAGSLGYEGLGGGKRSTEQNVSRNSFAVEIDTREGYPGNYETNEGTGSPAAPRTWHLGIDTANMVNSVVQTSEGLPDIFDPRGIHVRVRYNRGNVQVWLGPKAGSAGDALKKYLEADLLPISFGAQDQSAVFGFTASTGSDTETAEVDDLAVTRFAPAAAGSWARCDANGDGKRDLTDVIALLSALYQGGASSACAGAADCNSDGKVDLTDAIFELGFLFQSGPSPPAPYPGCEQFEGCQASPSCN